MDEEKVGLSTPSWLMLERADETDDVLTLRRLGMSLALLSPSWLDRLSWMLNLRMLGASLPHCMRSMSPSILTAVL